MLNYAGAAFFLAHFFASRVTWEECKNCDRKKLLKRWPWQAAK
jgi:hypothetical protein